MPDMLASVTSTSAQGAGAAPGLRHGIAYSVLIALLRAARPVSLRRPRRPGRPWPGRAHAHLCAALLELEMEMEDERAVAGMTLVDGAA